MKREFAIFGSALLAVTVGLGAVIARSEPKKPSWKGSIRIEMAELAKQAKISQANAEKAALAEAPGKLVSTELATESDSLLYEIKTRAGKKTREVLVDAGTGKIVPDGRQGSIVLGLRKMAKIEKADAQKTALEAVEGAAGDKSLGDSELEVEENYLVYEVDVKVKGKKGMWEVIVDAGTGKVLAREHETGGEE